ncbi:MAG: hypothetical protein KJS91_09335 [Planctomycetes bacterium]|nr:hypothetical protein [Planctomycetota bacterium]
MESGFLRHQLVTNGDGLRPKKGEGNEEQQEPKHPEDEKRRAIQPCSGHSRIVEEVCHPITRSGKASGGDFHAAVVVQRVRLGGLGRLACAAPRLLLAFFISFSQQELLLLRQRK